MKRFCRPRSRSRRGTQFEKLIVIFLPQRNDIPDLQTEICERTIGVARPEGCAGNPCLHVKSGREHFASTALALQSLALEPPLGFFDRVRDFAGYFPERIDQYENLLTGNPIWAMRTKGVARMTPEDAIALGATGPTLRGSGVDIDLRRDMPYSSYEKFQFKVPVSQEGDVFARYMCRVQELRESTVIVRQALDGMPEGPIKADAPGIVLPDREKMKTQMESLIYHFKIITEGFAVPAGEVYQAVESPRGEMGYYIVSDGTAKPYRVHMRAACLANLQTLPKMCEGRLLADVVAAIGSIDIVLGEIDR